MNYNEVLTKYADTITRIKENLGKIENPDRDYQALFVEYCQNPKNRQLGKVLQDSDDEFELTGSIDEDVKAGCTSGKLSGLKDQTATT